MSGHTDFDNWNWLASIPEKRRIKLLEIGHRVHFRNNQRIYLEGDEADGFYGVISGGVRLLSFPTAADRQIVSWILHKRDWFGEMSLIDGKPRAHEAVALGDTVLIKVGLSKWSRLVQGDHAYVGDLARLYTMHGRQMLPAMMERFVLGSANRLASTLLRLASADGDCASVVIQARQEDLADLVGVTRPSLNKLLRKFEREGIVSTGYSTVTVLDRGALQRVAQVVH